MIYQLLLAIKTSNNPICKINLKLTNHIQYIFILIMNFNGSSIIYDFISIIEITSSHAQWTNFCLTHNLLCLASNFLYSEYFTISIQKEFLHSKSLLTYKIILHKLINGISRLVSYFPHLILGKFVFMNPVKFKIGSCFNKIFIIVSVKKKIKYFIF